MAPHAHIMCYPHSVTLYECTVTTLCSNEILCVNFTRFETPTSMALALIQARPCPMALERNMRRTRERPRWALGRVPSMDIIPMNNLKIKRHCRASSGCYNGGIEKSHHCVGDRRRVVVCTRAHGQASQVHAHEFANYDASEQSIAARCVI